MQTDASPKGRGIAALRQGDSQTAIQLLLEALGANAKDPEVLSALGVAYCQQQRLPEGVGALRKAVMLAPTRAPLHFNLAKGLELDGQKDAALASYQSALRCDPAHAGAAQAVQRLTAAPSQATAVATPIAASPLADFALGSTGGVSGPVAPPAAPPPTPVPVSQVAPSAPSVRYGSPPRAAGPLRPMTSPAYVPPAAAAQPPARRGMPVGLIIGILVAVVVATGGVVTLMVALMLPAFQQARIAAQRARARSEAQGQFSAGPGGAGSYATPPVELGRPAAPGSDLERVGGGGAVSDAAYGFSASFPAGFGAPMPQQANRTMGLGGTASTQVYRATSAAGAAYVLCYAFPPEVYDQVQGQLFSLGQSGIRKSAGGALRSRSSRYQGYAAQDLEFGGAGRAQGTVGRARLVLARPRLFLIGFEARDRALLSKPGVTAFLDSLRIQDNVYPPSVQAPLQAPSRPSMPQMPQMRDPSFPSPSTRMGSPPSGFGAPSFPDRPSGAPSFTPPDIPTPPRPDFPSMGRPPAFGPRGPRFGPRGPESSSGDSPGFGPSGVPGGGFGPGGPPSGSTPGN